MEPEQTSKKFLVIPLGVVVLIVAALVVLWINSADAPLDTETKEEVVIPKVERIYTEAEKLQILADIASSSQKDTTTTAQDLKTLQNLSKTAPPDKTSTEEKLRILESLSSGSN